LRILIVDEDPVHRRILEILLNRCGHDVTAAAGGQEAWALLQRDEAPALAILDSRMSNPGALEICRRLRAQKHTTLPYLIVTVPVHQCPDIQAGLEAGVDDYLVKPLDLPALRARVAVGKRVLDLRRLVQAAREELRFQAQHDQLTGLPNRGVVLAALEREVQRSRRQNQPLGVMLVALDDLRHINACYGHQAGDRALIETARRTASSVRAFDTLGRMTGQEFLIIMPGCDAQTTLKQAERIREVLAGPLDLHGPLLPISVSIGVATAGLCRASNAEALLGAATEALGQAQRAGRNRVQLFAGTAQRPEVSARQSD
jgi:diguanylate cyclase (GGDEF)-like protein